MKEIILAALVLLFSTDANAQQQLDVAPPAKTSVAKPVLPPNAYDVLPMVEKAIDAIWPSIPYRSFVPAMIEQETCIHLKHRMCFNPRAELKTHREYGFGMGQTTIAYRTDGSVRFNTWAELRAKHPNELREWTWENRYNAEMQIRSILLKNRTNFALLKFETANTFEKMAFLAVTYNSGSVLPDRNLCKRTPGCNPIYWFGNVEKNSLKSAVPAKGYKKSFREISREYPENVLKVRRPKYIPYLGS